MAAGDGFLIGAPGFTATGGGGGAAYLFDGPTGALLRTFSNPSPAAGDTFGYGLAVLGDRVAVGDPSDNTRGENGTGEEFTGAVYLIDGDSGALSETLLGVAYLQRFGGGLAALGGGLAVTSASPIDVRSIQIFSPCSDGTVDPQPFQADHDG